MAINFFVIPLRSVLFINVSFSCYYNFVSPFMIPYIVENNLEFANCLAEFDKEMSLRDNRSLNYVIRWYYERVILQSFFFFFYHEFNSFARITRLKRGDSILRGSRVFIINFLRTIRLKLNSIEGRTRLEVSFGKAIQFFPFKIQFTITRPRL